MKGNEQLIKSMNFLLADELAAVNQYILHSEMCANWGYGKLHHAVEKRAIDEMKHAEKLIGRILFLEGLPTVSNLHPIHIGATVVDQLANDSQAEYGAVTGYNDAIRLAVEVGDNTTRALLESILHDEEDHIDWLEAQRDQIAQAGLAVYLGQQIE
jgi:bacterioferritin